VLYPFIFHPIFKERVWGGRSLATLYGKGLPPEAPIGESWEISDRPGDESVIANGAFAGLTLRWLMERYRDELLGERAAAGGRFPLLCKILDARDRLSLQVHPPAGLAAALGGEPKTEMWYIADAAPGAELFVGLKRGVTRAELENKVRTGEVAECFHRVAVRPGDTMFLPSGRVHAIGAGLVIFEIQQSSDTTYRVFDWNRTGLDGRPRALHLSESLASIDFDDIEPSLVEAPITRDGHVDRRALVRDPLFHVDWCGARAEGSLALGPPRLRIVAVAAGRLTLSGKRSDLRLKGGQFCLLPANLPEAVVAFGAGAAFLIVEA
jgi:mannose-6-phosphate isomerase